ncbi:MAG TPA: hypothetical protein VGR50_07570 [Terriglobales bacterium]|nr:hypothetical protein [Terriglobales bacterium]
MKDNLKERSEEKEARRTGSSAKTEEQNNSSIHDQDTAEIEVPESLRKDSNEKAA